MKELSFHGKKNPDLVKNLGDKRRAKRQNIPQTYLAKIGNLKIEKGSLNGKEIITWDVVDMCLKEDCIIQDRCPYKDSYTGIVLDVPRCTVQLKYMSALARTVFTNFEDLDAVVIHRIGTNLFPLYRILIKLKIAELGVKNYVLAGEKGGVRIHPILAEIRSTINLIDNMWSRLGLSGKDIEMPGMDELVPANYYESIEKASSEMMKK